MISKQEARLIAVKHYNSLDDNQKSIKSNEIVNKIINSDLYKKSKNIALFYYNKNEVNLLKLLKDETKTFLFPKINKNKKIDFIIFNNQTIWKKNIFDIFEPINGKINNNIDIIYIPMLARNNKNYRLGYGGGYYDKYLAENIINNKIGILFDNLTIDFNEENHDVKLNDVISNEG